MVGAADSGHRDRSALELCRLTAEYLLSRRLSWSPILRAPRTVIADADGDGFGRVLHIVPEPSTAAESFGFVALSAEPISALAGDTDAFTWAVRVDEWAGSGLTVGVAFPDAKLIAPRYGVCDRAYGVFFASSRVGPVAVHDSKPIPVVGWTHSMPTPAHGRLVQVRLTAFLKFGAVRLMIEHVPKGAAGEALPDDRVAAPKRIAPGSWIFRVPDLSRCHLRVAGSRSFITDAVRADDRAFGCPFAC